MQLKLFSILQFWKKSRDTHLILGARPSTAALSSMEGDITAIAESSDSDLNVAHHFTVLNINNKAQYFIR